MRFFTPILLSACLLAFPAAAEDSPFKGGMQYTVFGASSAAKSKPQENTALKEKTISPAIPAKIKDEEQSDSISKVWSKYQDLANGTAVDPEKAPAEETEDTSEAVQEQAPPKTGIAAVLDMYHQNKAQQGQLNSIDVPRPKLPKKPVVENR